jgi:hypothetical protein
LEDFLQFQATFLLILHSTSLTSTLLSFFSRIMIRLVIICNFLLLFNLLYPVVCTLPGF